MTNFSQLRSGIAYPLNGVAHAFAERPNHESFVHSRRRTFFKKLLSSRALPPTLLLCALFLTGCISGHNDVAQSQLPPSWIAALPKPASVIPDVSGTYTALGQGAMENTANKDHPQEVQINDKANLIRQFFADKDLTAGVEEVQLQQHGGTELEVTGWRNGQIVLMHTFHIKTYPATGAVVLPSINNSDAGGNMAAAALGSTTVSLFKGTDGCLYLQNYTWSAGVVALVVPFNTSEGWWGRWTPTPTPSLGAPQ